MGRLAPAAWHTTARTDTPARAGGSPGAAVALPPPALTGPATAALAGRSGTSPRRSPAGGVPVTPLGATRLRPYGSSGRATARSVAGRLLRFREAAQGGAGARPEARQGGEAALYRQERQRSAQPPAGEGGAKWRQSRPPAVPRTGATAAEAARVPGAPGPAWPAAALMTGCGAGVAGTTGDGSSSGWGAVSACSRWRIRVVMASSTVAVRRGADRSGAASMVWAACRALRRSTRSPTVGSAPLGLLVRRAGQRGLELGAERRQGLQIGGMGKSCPQPGFIVP